MPLTTAQKTALKTDIAGNTNTIPVGRPFAGTAINALANGPDQNNEIALWYGLTASPDFFVFRTDVSIKEIFDQVIWANYTPSDPPDANVIWSNRSLACQGKQFNLQIMLQGQPNFDASRISLRAGLNDATTNLPSGTAGALRSGGWTGILVILRRLARNIEKLFAEATTGVGTGTGVLGATGNPGLMKFEGTITGDDVEAARNS